jgi:hypothetical protein
MDTFFSPLGRLHIHHNHSRDLHVAPHVAPHVACFHFSSKILLHGMTTQPKYLSKKEPDTHPSDVPSTIHHHHRPYVRQQYALVFHGAGSISAATVEEQLRNNDRFYVIHVAWCVDYLSLQSGID